MRRPGELGKDSHSARSAMPEARANDAAQESPPLSRRRRAPWTITQEFLHGGYRYRLIRRQLTARAGFHLTPRENEALSHLREGVSNREIARRLGVAPSTVGVLLFRASAKFRVTTREALIAAYESFQSTRRLADGEFSFTDEE